MVHASPTVSTKQRIFETAVALFSRDGFSGISIRDLTKAVGIKESSFYNHFKSKADVLEAIFDHFEAQMAQLRPPEDLGERLATVPPSAVLAIGLQRFMEVADTPLMACIYRIIVIEQFRDPRARDLMLGLYEAPVAQMKGIFALMASSQAALAQQLAVSYQYALHALVAEFSLLKQYDSDTTPLQTRLQGHVDFFGQLTTAIQGGKLP